MIDEEKKSKHRKIWLGRQASGFSNNVVVCSHLICVKRLLFLRRTKKEGHSDKLSIARNNTSTGTTIVSFYN